MEQGTIPSVPLLSGWWRSIKAGLHPSHRSFQPGQLPTGRRQQVYGEADHQVLVDGHTLGNQQGDMVSALASREDLNRKLLQRV